jgi:hypothetical protein
MDRIRIVGLAMVAALALGAFAASSASALPELGRCVAKAGGKYKDSNCTEKATGGSFEFVKNAIKKKFTSEGGEGVLETVSGNTVKCTKETAVGEYLEKGTTPSTKEVHHVVATFTGCSAPALGLSCKTAGHAEGEIVTNELEGKMGYISGKGTKTPVVGQELKPGKTAPGKLFAKFECGPGLAIIEVGKGTVAPTGNDCIIAPIAPVNVMALTATETYSGSAGKQNPEKFSTSTKICNLESRTNGGAWERATQALTATVIAEEELEIKG